MIVGGKELAIVPVGRPRISVARDARLALIVDETTASVVDLSTGTVRGTIEVPPACDIGWLDGSAVIVVAQARTRVIDTSSQTPQVFDRTFAAPMRLSATCASAALLSDETGASVITCSATGITAHSFPARGAPSVAGTGAGRFLVAIGSSIEEWDPVARSSRRRLRLPESTRVRALGGTERTVWFIAHETPARIDTLVLVALNQPKVHELPEPIAQVAAHPRLELLWCLGVSGRVYLVDLDGRTKQRIVADHVEAIGVGVGTAITLLVARTGHPVEVSVTSTVAAKRSPIGRKPDAAVAAPPPIPDPARWRDELVDWTRHGDVMGAPIAPAVAALAERFAFRAELLPAIALCYGAHLCGESGVPLVDITLVLGGLWDEALGRGELASKRVVLTVESRAELSAVVRR
ncbi:MAG: hypothetical protein H0T79_10670, partial [Deltaproteobacteria bacterium]|nr:hypothetical protein [Deltaproteobacteria bacterium]